MKRQGNIYTELYNKNNIRKAIIKASLGKKTRKNVKKIIDNIDFYVEELYQMLKGKKVKLSLYKKMIIHDGANKKERIIFKPAFYPE